MFKNILVPLDGSSFSAKALPVAAALAKRTGAAIHLVTVLDPAAYVPFVPGEVLMPVMDTDALATRRAADTEAITAEADRWAAEGLTVTGTLLEGSVVESLAEHSAAIDAGLVVMTTHGRGGLQRLWLGSVASSFLNRTPAPVFLLRPNADATPETDSVLPTGPLLLPLDGSAFAESVVEHATAFAAALEIPISLFTVAIPNAIPMAPFGTEALLAEESDLTRQEMDAKLRLRLLANTLPDDTTTDVATDMTAARAIIEKADAIGAGVIAMATHGRTGIARLMMGSCSDAVLRGASQPMLLYRPTEQPT